LEVVDAVFAVVESVVAESEVDGGEELAVDVCEVLVEGVVLDGLAGEGGVGLSQQLVVDADAVVGEGFSVAIVNALADL
jgi:hypothetical protein